MALALLHAGSMRVTTNDLHVYLVQGRWMWEHGALLEREVFTWTAAGAPFINGTWLFSVTAYALHQLGGYDLLRVVNGLAVAAAVAGVALAGRARAEGRTRADWRAAAVAAVYAWALIFQNMVVRGQTWVFPLFAALWGVRAGPRRRGRPAGGGLLLGAVWNGLHGSFPAGIALAGAVALGDALDSRSWRAGRTGALAGAGLAAGACLGPYGPGVWSYISSNTSLPVDRGFSEWLPPSLEGFEGARFFAALALWVWLLGRRGRRTPTADLLVLLGFGYLALTSTRFVAWFGLATAPLLASRLAEGLGEDEGLPRRLLGPVSALLAVLWLLFLGRGLAPQAPPLAPEPPVALVAAISAAAESGRLFGPMEYGGYAAFTLGEGWLHSGDIRAWVFDDDAWSLYLDVSRAHPGWEEALEAHGVTHLLTWRAFHGETLEPAADASPRWEKIAEAETGAAYRRATWPDP